MIVTLLLSVVPILLFILTFRRLAFISVSQHVLEITFSGLAAIANRNLTDEEKESAIRTAGVSLLKATFQILWRFTACFAVAVLPVALFDYLGVVSAQATMELMLRWDYIAGTTLVLVGVGWIAAKRRGKGGAESAYSTVDQMTHKLAFAGPEVQLAAADLEDRIYAKAIHATKLESPIFIAALPRAGTTVLLEALSALPSVSTHRYRDMPFLLSPILWSRISSLFRKRSQLVERAHGDGILVGYDSPEAFEEVLWRLFWPEKYHGDKIEIWDRTDIKTEASEFFERHVRKVVFLRSDGHGRYVSKNNNNIARLDLLPHMFPEAETVVPVREPSEHAASLLRQHENFLRQHSMDPFIERYMKDIGHLEFGNLHVPFAFDGFDPSAYSPREASYWLEYWIAAYQMVLARVDRLHIVTHERICKHPKLVMDALCERLRLDHSGVDLSIRFHEVNGGDNRSSLRAERMALATDLYHAIRKHEV